MRTRPVPDCPARRLRTSRAGQMTPTTSRSPMPASTARPAARRASPVRAACSRSTIRRPRRAIRPRSRADAPSSTRARASARCGPAVARCFAPTSRARRGRVQRWSTTALADLPLCGGSLVVGVGAVPTGLRPYKLVDGADVVARSARTRRSRTTTSPATPTARTRAQHARLGQRSPRARSIACARRRSATAAMSPRTCRPATTRPTPRRARIPCCSCTTARTSGTITTAASVTPAGRSTCTLDTEIAAHRVAPVIVIAADQHDRAQRRVRPRRTAAMETFMTFQIDELQPRALAKVRGDRRACSSPAARSAAWSRCTSRCAIRRRIAGARRCRARSGPAWTSTPRCAISCRAWASSRSRSISITAATSRDNSDGAADTVEVRDLMVQMGWQRADSPSLHARPRTRSATTTSPARPTTSWRGRRGRGASFGSCSRPSELCKSGTRRPTPWGVRPRSATPITAV